MDKRFDKSECYQGSLTWNTQIHTCLNYKQQHADIWRCTNRNMQQYIFLKRYNLAVFPRIKGELEQKWSGNLPSTSWCNSDYLKEGMFTSLPRRPSVVGKISAILGGAERKCLKCWKSFPRLWFIVSHRDFLNHDSKRSKNVGSGGKSWTLIMWIIIIWTNHIAVSAYN